MYGGPGWAEQLLTGWLGVVLVVVFVLLVILALLWFILPFAVFGIKDRLYGLDDRLIESNKLLAELLSVAKAHLPPNG